MADLRIPPSLPSVVGPTPARSTEAVRAAQRAFFNTALADAGAATTARPASAAAATAQAAPAATPLRSQTVASAESKAAPTRMLRPGLLLDIRI